MVCGGNGARLITDNKGFFIHYHDGFTIWLMFFVGVLLHVALQIDDIARKNKWTREAVSKAIGIPVAYRTFATACTFGLIWHYPLIISKLLAFFGHPVSADTADLIAIPMNYFIAGIYGLSLDSAFGYIPGLKSWLPAVEPAAASLDTAAKLNVKAGEAIQAAQEAVQQPPPEKL